MEADLQQVVNNPSTSFWLRDAIFALSKRDPVDAANDAEFLAQIFAKKLSGQLAATNQIPLAPSWEADFGGG
jgi:hypothetical protein